MPSFIRRSKNEAFNHIKHRVWKRLNGWKEKSLSAVGKKVLIKVVAQIIPTYVMSCFVILEGICHEINSMIACFLWDQKEDRHKIHWKNLKGMCMAKEDEGMSFQLLVFNKVFLAKQSWRLLKFLNSLVARVLKAKYYLNSSIMEAQLGANPSFSWRSIWGERSLLEKGIR